MDPDLSPSHSTSSSSLVSEHPAVLLAPGCLHRSFETTVDAVLHQTPTQDRRTYPPVTGGCSWLTASLGIALC